MYLVSIAWIGVKWIRASEQSRQEFQMLSRYSGSTTSAAVVVQPGRPGNSTGAGSLELTSLAPHAETVPLVASRSRTAPPTPTLIEAGWVMKSADADWPSPRQET